MCLQNPLDSAVDLLAVRWSGLIGLEPDEHKHQVMTHQRSQNISLTESK